MQWLVRDAQQSAVGHAEPIALGGNGGALHVDSDGAALIEPAHSERIAQLPVAVVRGGDGAGAQAALQFRAAFAGHLLGAVVERALHFRQRRHRHRRRQHVVQHVVVTQVSVSQHIVADGLRMLQTTAVPNHQPRVRTQHSQVVTDVLGIRRANADVHQRDARAIGADEVIRRHLVAPPWGGRDGGFRVGRFARHHYAARTRQRRIGAPVAAQLCAGPAHELVHIAMVVREENVRLYVLGRGAGVVAHARQREIRA